MNAPMNSPVIPTLVGPFSLYRPPIRSGWYSLLRDGVGQPAWFDHEAGQWFDAEPDGLEEPLELPADETVMWLGTTEPAQEPAAEAA